MIENPSEDIGCLLEVKDGKTFVPLANIRDKNIEFLKDQCLGRAEVIELCSNVKVKGKIQSFGLNISELGSTTLTKMDIKEVEGSKPVCIKPYKTNAHERGAIKEIVREWRENCIVSDTRSPYASPVLLVKKKTGGNWLVIDYRRLNSQTIKDKFPLPKIDYLLEQLHDCSFFTTLNLAHE
ncbi:hypothetical protein AVEN_23404-1 [Araneus ventricosus]|uniref:Transposon Ty3-I Gag-Pol polyprotein n=1 Tax=Araneus ventricosus TaxID=182803 RepID=A0A4Y2E7W7_ARAVE|nr:hypothetical protein AVEN_23404-1 [Araneus ventricosus]